MSDHAVRFRCRWGPTFLFLLVYTQLGYLALMTPVGVLVTLADPRAVWIWIPILLGCLFCAASSALFTPLIVLGYPTYVLPAGLKGYNFWGLYHTVRWEAVTDVRPLNAVVARFVRVFSTRTWLPLWVPLFLDDTDRFAELVREYAGDDHPLTIELDRAAAREEEP